MHEETCITSRQKIALKNEKKIKQLDKGLLQQGNITALRARKRFGNSVRIWKTIVIIVGLMKPSSET